MSLLGNGLKGGLGTGIGIGIGVAIAAPIVWPIIGAILKPAAKAGLVGGITLFEKSRELVGDVVAEAKAETYGSRTTAKRSSS